MVFAWSIGSGLAFLLVQQGRDSSLSEMDPHDCIDMTGPWAGFGFQAAHMFAPKVSSSNPATWLSGR
jgi:hypothetical protein